MLVNNETLPSSSSIDSSLNQESSPVLSQEETRLILTPFAFKIDESLFGIALASPVKRALAILIDLCLIALLSDTPGEILAVLIAIVLYRLGLKSNVSTSGVSTKKKGKKRRGLLRGFAIFIIFLVLLDLLPNLFNQISGLQDESAITHNTLNNEKLVNERGLITVSGKPLSSLEIVAFSALSANVILTIDNSVCMTLVCWKDELSPLVREFSAFNFSQDLLNDITQTIVESTELNASEQEEFKIHLMNEFQESLMLQEMSLKSNVQEKDSEILHESDENSQSNPLTRSNDAVNNSTIPTEKNNRQVYSVIKWVQGIIEDLGLGFGWAAFYFTVFTSLWQGKTPGKKLLGIRVLHLNSKTLTIWESFCRYGGYGAGIATGLLGFLQIFWNPNRQAIQDQISATVVIDEKSRKV